MDLKQHLEKLWLPYKNAVVKSIEVYGDMHRYIPPLAKYAGFTKIGEKVVQHQARKYGVTKFGLNRFVNGPLDLMTVAFMGKFGKKPMHFFGVFGMMMFFIGFVALAAMIIGVQFFLTGFIAEMIGRNASQRNVYLVEKKLNVD